jgi:hypothetical protein
MPRAMHDTIKAMMRKTKPTISNVEIHDMPWKRRGIVPGPKFKTP